MNTGGTTSPQRRPRKPPPAFVGRGGGVGPRSPKPSGATAGGYTLPPFLTFDPGISAQIRASERGLEDLEADTREKSHFARTDLAQALRDIHTATSRGRGDLRRSMQRGHQRIGEEESDARLKAARANQDFDTQLQNIGRQFAQLGHRQGESANAAGVLDGGTQAAALAARSRNQTLAEAPIHTARARVGEDFATAMRRLRTADSELDIDFGRELGELHDDRDRDRLLARRDTGRKLRGYDNALERGRREEVFAVSDLTDQAIYEARANRPGAFTKTGKKKKRR